MLGNTGMITSNLATFQDVKAHKEVERLAMDECIQESHGVI